MSDEDGDAVVFGAPKYVRPMRLTFTGSRRGVPLIAPEDSEGTPPDPARRQPEEEVLPDAGVPTARAEVVTDLAHGLAALHEIAYPVVIKAVGLAAGKGVVIARDRQEAVAVLTAFLEDAALGKAGQTVLIEDYRSGQEMPVFALTDGDHGPTDPTRRAPEEVDVEALAQAIFDSYEDCWDVHDMLPWDDQPEEVRRTNRWRAHGALDALTAQGVVVVRRDDLETLRDPAGFGEARLREAMKRTRAALTAAQDKPGASEG